MEFQSKTYEGGKVRRIRTAKETKKYISAVRNFAKANDLPLCDTEALLMEEAKSHMGGLSSLYEDGEYLTGVFELKLTTFRITFERVWVLSNI
jgi:hypothetical protein